MYLPYACTALCEQGAHTGAPLHVFAMVCTVNLRPQNHRQAIQSDKIQSHHRAFLHHRFGAVGD